MVMSRSTSYPTFPWSLRKIGSIVECFDLKSTYLGCAIQTKISAGVPEPCTVQFNGTKTNTKVVCEECTFSGTVLTPALVECTFSTLKSVKSVNETVVRSDTMDPTVESLDNVVGVLHFSS